MIPDSLRQIYAKLKLDAKIKTPKSNQILKKLTSSDYFALGIGTCGGVGYMPIVPATWGSLVGVGIFLLAQKASEYLTIWADDKQLSLVLLESARASVIVVFLIALFLIGIWASTRVEKLTGKKDSSIIVIDEVVGQLIVFLVVPANLGWWTVFAGFIVFRVFDIWKPYPSDEFEALPKGLGTMADDAMAGFYGAAFMSILCTLHLVIF